MPQYKDSYSYGVAALLVIAGWAADMIAVRIALGLLATACVVWPTLHQRFRMTFPVALALVSLLGVTVGLFWQFAVYGLTFRAVSVATGPEVTMRLVYPTDPSIILQNQSPLVAKQIKWTVELWNLDDPRTYINADPAPNAHDPLPIPIATFDFLRANTNSGPMSIIDRVQIPFVKKGQRLFGSMSAVCPDCVRGHTYIVDIVYGVGGWYSELTDEKDGSVIIPRILRRDTVKAYADEFLKKTPESARIPIAAN